MQDALLYFVIAIIWGLASWWQKRKEENEAKNWSDSEWLDQSPTQPRTPGQTSTPTPAPKPSSGGGWEEELRRLLEGDLEAPKPAPPRPASRSAAPVGVPGGQRTAPLPAPRPTTSYTAPPPAPPPVAQAKPAKAVRQTSGFSAPKLVSDIDGDYFHKGLCVHCGGRLLFPDGAIGHSLNCPHCNEDTPLRPLASLEDHPAGRAYAGGGGAHAHESMASQISELFSVHESAQRAVVASIVFGKPKSLEKEGETNLF